MRRPSFTRQFSTESAGRKTPEPVANGVVTGVPPPSTEGEGVHKKIWSSTRKKLTVACLAIVYFATCAAFSVLSPFFPNEAKNKGASGTVVGLIFGMYSLTNFIVSPIFGTLLPKIGPRFGITCGLLLNGGAEILFGFVHLMPSGAVFIAFCLLLRIVSALGGAMSDVSIFAIVAGEFQTNVGAVLGIMETFAGLGFMVGPPLGGALYTIGGFKMPFLVLGVVVILTLPLVMFVLPITDTTPQEQETGSLLQTLRIPAISVLASCILLSGVIIGFLDPTLAPHLNKFGLNASKVGLMFLLIGGTYAIIAPFVGWIADKTGRTRVLIVIGISLSVISYLLLGPTPLIPILPQRKVWLAGISLVVVGLSYSFYLVPVMPDMLITARNHGLPDDIRTHGVLSGIFGALISIGAFLGPTLGGSMNHYLGFNWSTTVLAGISALQGVVLIIFTCCEKVTKRPRTESIEPLNEKSRLLPNPQV